MIAHPSWFKNEDLIQSLRNGCEQALLLLERERFADDPEAKVVRAVLKGALASSQESSQS